MFFRILKRDLERKKTVNAILILFIVLSTMFVASGLNNVITVINGTDYYFDQAGVGDYVIITMGDQAVGGIEAALADEPAVESCRIERVVFGSPHNITLEDGSPAKTKNTTLFQSVSESRLSFFDSGNQKIEEIAPGQAYVTGAFFENNKAAPGDKIRIVHTGVEMELVLAGKAKDALLGSGFMGNTRVLLCDADLERLRANENIRQHYQGEVAYIKTDEPAAVSAALADIPGVTFNGSRAVVKMCYVMDLIVAFVMLILSICLIIVSFVVLKFSISFTIEEDFREIGVMKAVGISNGRIRSLYLVKYLCAAAVGAVIGFAASIPFGNMLLESVSNNMVLGNTFGLAANGAGAGLVVAAVVLFAWSCTAGVNRLSPLDAIRSGQTGERYRKKSFYRLGRSHATVHLYLAVNDIVSSPRRFLSILLSIFVCTLLMLLIVNTTATMKSPNLITTFSTASDLYVTDVGDSMETMSADTREGIEAELKHRGEELAALGMPAEFRREIQYKYKVTFEGRDTVLTCAQGIGTTAADYTYTEGVVPQSAREIAITPQVSELTGAKIGDVVMIDFGTQKMECIVTAYFESMNQLGQIIRLHEDAPTDMQYVANVLQYQIIFTDEPSEAEIENRKARLKELYHNDGVMDATEFCIDCIGVVDMMESVQYLLLVITMVVVVLVTILMERSLVADEKSQIAILKAIGFHDHSIVAWHIWRFVLVAGLAVFLAALVSLPMTKLCISPIFGMMGARKIHFRMDPLQIFVLYPAIVLGAAVMSAQLTAQCTRRITSRDTSNIE